MYFEYGENEILYLKSKDKKKKHCDISEKCNITVLL